MDEDDTYAALRERITTSIEALTDSLAAGEARSMHEYRYMCGHLDGLRRALELMEMPVEFGMGNEQDAEDESPRISIH